MTHILRFVIVAAFLMAGPAWGQPVPSREPSSTHVFPAGGKRGTVIKARVGGECLPPEMNLQILGAGVASPSILGPEIKAHYETSLRRTPNDADAVGAGTAYPREFDASIAIAADAEPGARASTGYWNCWSSTGSSSAWP